MIYLDSEEIEADGLSLLGNVDAVLIPGGFGESGTEGMIEAVRIAREPHVPVLGICLGLQIAVIEFARHVAGLEDAHSTEFKPNCINPVIALVSEWITRDGTHETRSEGDELGGTLRLGSQDAKLMAPTKSHAAYGRDTIHERHRHRYEFNNQFLETLESAGLIVSGISEDELVEMVELPGHPWFVACQFHPEFTSTPRDGHPLFSQFIRAACVYRDDSMKQERAVA